MLITKKGIQVTKDKHKQIDIGGQLSVHTRDIQYVKRCKPYGNDILKESQLMIRLHDGDKIYLTLGEKLSKVFYKKINDIMQGIEVLTVEDVKKIM
jgi:hypothetical protein